MEIKGYFNDTDEVEATIEISMMIKEWKKLKEVIPESYPFWKISSAISSVIYEMEKVQTKQIEDD